MKVVTKNMLVVSRVMLVSVFTNIFLAILKLICGVLYKSSALVADGIHSFSDLVTDFCAILGSHLAHRPADDEHPYGHGKLEYLTSMVIGLVILVLGFNIIYTSIDKKVVIPSIMVAFISMITVIVKYILSFYVIKKGKEHRNSILIASGIESRTDCLSSIVVLVSALLSQFSNVFPILKYADLVATIIVGIFIVKVGLNTLKENMNMILGEQENDPEYLEQLSKTILKKQEISHIDELYLMKYGYYYQLQVTISMDANITLKKAHEIVDELEARIQKKYPKIQYINVHMEPDDEKD